MAGPFTVYTPARPGGYLQTDGPERIEEYRFARKPWQGNRVPRGWQAKPTDAKKWIHPKNIGDVLHNEYPDDCWQCKKAEADDCGENCIQQFRDNNFKYEAQIWPAEFGQGAFNGKEKLPEKTFIGEYLGDLIPINDAPDSIYRMEVEGVFCVDAEKAGNWTRYINSSCDPNLHCRRVCIGKRFGLFFQTLREILPGEELTFSYGYDYFAGKGMKCGCDWKTELHDAKGGPTRKKQSGTNTGETTDVSTEEEASPPSKQSKSSKGLKQTEDKVASGRVTKSSREVSSKRASFKDNSSTKPASKGRVTKSYKEASEKRASSKDYASIEPASKASSTQASSTKTTTSSKGTTSSKTTAPSKAATSSKSSTPASPKPAEYRTRSGRISKKPPPR